MAAWTEAELALVDDASLSVPEVARLTGRPASSVEKQAARRGVDRSFRRGCGLKRGDDNPWSEQELTWLADVALSLAEVSRRTNRTYGAVKAMASRCGFARYSPWSAADLVLLGDLELPLTEVAQRTGRPLGTVYAEASTRGIARGAQAGPQHYRWTGGWSVSDRNPSWRGADWPEFRAAALERDGYCCQECGLLSLAGRGLVVHHIIPWRLRPVNDLRWLVTLCSSHHTPRSEHLWAEIPSWVEDQLALEHAPMA
jgi:hypothetical protein